MKKLFVMIALTLCAAIMLFKVNAKNDIVRIHIRAASDSEYDQQVKIQVRDVINEYLAPKLKDVKTKKQAEKVIFEELSEIEKIGESIAGCDVSARLTQENFPEKTYGNKTYPAGEYTALIIEIGGGEGRNWWCVAFPPMCYTTNESGKTQYRSLIYDFLERIGLI